MWQLIHHAEEEEKEGSDSGKDAGGEESESESEVIPSTQDSKETANRSSDAAIESPV